MAAGVRDLQRCELIEGDLIDKMGKNRPHVNSPGADDGVLPKVLHHEEKEATPQRIRRFIFFGVIERDPPNRVVFSIAKPPLPLRLPAGSQSGGKASTIQSQWRETQSGPPVTC